jgi:quercetin 2,3-dioxygenase
MHPRKEQICDILNDRNVYECKIVGLPEENSKIKAYSNLFYWSCVWSEKGGNVSEHTHFSFDVLTLVIRGELLHHDSKEKKQIKLGAGDIEVTRAGNFVSHSERLSPGTEYLQIWIDPDIKEPLVSPNPREKYDSGSFPVFIEPGKITKYYSGEGSSVKQIIENTVIKDLTLSVKLHKFELASDQMMSGYVVDGEIKIEDFQLVPGDFFLVKDQKEVAFISKTESRMILVESPNRPNYKTYAEKFL